MENIYPWREEQEGRRTFYSCPFSLISKRTPQIVIKCYLSFSELKMEEKERTEYGMELEEDMFQERIYILELKFPRYRQL